MNTITDFREPSNVPTLETAKIPSDELFERILEFIYPQLEFQDCIDLFFVSKKVCLITGDELTKKKIHNYFFRFLNLKLPANFNPNEQISFLKDHIENCYRNLKIIPTVLINSYTENCMENYFLMPNPKINPVIPAQILKMFALKHFETANNYKALEILKAFPKSTEREEVISHIFSYYISHPYYLDDDPRYFLKYPFITFLIQNGEYGKAFELSVQYKGTEDEYNLVEHVLRQLFFQGKITLSLTFIRDKFKKLNYILIIPKLFLERDKVDSALIFARKVKNDKYLYNNIFQSPYSYILKIIILYQIEKKRFQEAIDITLLLVTKNLRDKYLIHILEHCIKKNISHLIKQIISMIESKEIQEIAVVKIQDHIISTYLLEHDIYTNLNQILSDIKADGIDTNIKYIIDDYKSSHSLDLKMYTEYSINQSIPSNIKIESNIYRILVSHYLKLNDISSAKKIVGIMPITSGFSSHKSSEALRLIRALVQQKSFEEAKSVLPMIIVDSYFDEADNLIYPKTEEPPQTDDMV